MGEKVSCPSGFLAHHPGSCQTGSLLEPSLLNYFGIFLSDSEKGAQTGSSRREGEVIWTVSTFRKGLLQCGANITVDYWQGQGRLSFFWFLIPMHFIHCKFPGDACVPMFVCTAQCATTIRTDNKENTEKISHSLWNWVTGQYERDRNYVYMDMSYWGHHQFAYILHLTGRYSLLSKNDLHMNTGGIRITLAFLLAIL